MEPIFQIINLTFLRQNLSHDVLSSDKIELNELIKVSKEKLSQKSDSKEFMLNLSDVLISSDNKITGKSMNEFQSETVNVLKELSGINGVVIDFFRTENKFMKDLSFGNLIKIINCIRSNFPEMEIVFKVDPDMLTGTDPTIRQLEEELNRSKWNG